MNKDNKKIFAIAITGALTFIVSISLFFGYHYMHDLDNHHAYPYRNWKYNNGPFHENFWELLKVDVKRDELIKGKTREEIKRKFGFIRERSEADDYQKYYNNQSEKDGIWLADSPWFVIMENGKGITMELMKG